MALRILARSVSETIAGLVRARDTVMVPTPARCATSVRVTALRWARGFRAADGTGVLVIGDKDWARVRAKKPKSFGFARNKIALSSLLSSFLSLILFPILKDHAQKPF